MVKVLCIVQARLTSSRLPDKVVMPLGRQGKTIAEHVFERLSCSRHIDQVVFAIPTGERNDELETFLTERHMPCFRGSEDNVLERFIGCIRQYQPEIVVRATSDNPFVDWHQADLQIILSVFNFHIYIIHGIRLIFNTSSLNNQEKIYHQASLVVYPLIINI